MYKNNSRDSSKFKGYSPLQLSCNLTGKRYAVGYYSYTDRYSQLTPMQLTLMKLLYIPFLIFIFIGCKTSNKKEILREKQFESISFYNDSLTDRILYSAFTKYDGKTFDGIRSLINLRKIRKLYKSKLIENSKNDNALKDILDSFVKTTAIAYGNYYKLEPILEKDLDAFNLKQVISNNEKLEKSSVPSIVIQYFEKIKYISNSEDAIVFIEELHKELISKLIDNNSLTEFSVDDIKHLEASLSANTQVYTNDSVKISLLINDSIKCRETIFIWRTDSKSEARNKFIGRNLTVSKKHDTIYGESPLYKNDTVYWKPWKTSIVTN